MYTACSLLGTSTADDLSMRYVPARCNNVNRDRYPLFCSITSKGLCKSHCDIYTWSGGVLG